EKRHGRGASSSFTAVFGQKFRRCFPHGPRPKRVRSPLHFYPVHTFAKSFQIRSSGRGATALISSFLTGCTKETLLECNEMPPPSFERLAPYLRSPFIGQPAPASWALIW